MASCSVLTTLSQVAIDAIMATVRSGDMEAQDMVRVGEFITRTLRGYAKKLSLCSAVMRLVMAVGGSVETAPESSWYRWDDPERITPTDAFDDVQELAVSHGRRLLRRKGSKIEDILNAIWAPLLINISPYMYVKA